MSDVSATSTTPPPASELPPMPEEAVLMAEGKIRFVPDNRELEKAPRMLRVAAITLVVACLIPWVGHGGGLFTNVIAKVVALLACFMFYAAVISRTKDPVPAGLGALTKKRWGKPYAYKTKGFVEGLAHTIPTPLHVLAIVVTIASLVIAFKDPLITSKLISNAGALGEEATNFMVNRTYALAEVGLLLLGGMTLVHIYSYRRGGHFSPLYPFVFLGALMMAGTRILFYVSKMGAKNPFDDSNLVILLGLAGSLLATVAGGIAVFTIVTAMIEAKKQGDAKKAAALEARKAARQAKKA